MNMIEQFYNITIHKRHILFRYFTLSKKISLVGTDKLTKKATH